MTVFGVDIHARYQAGINIEHIASEGFTFMAVKVSEGTDTYGGLPWLERGKNAGMLCMAYHYLRPGRELAQAEVFVRQCKLTGVPGMLDAEALGRNNTAALTVGGIRAFITACRTMGGRVPLLYLPHWYWERMGRPSLKGLPPIWASSYVPGTDTAAKLYTKVTDRRWQDYGGNRTVILQFSDKGQVAGYKIDVNAYRGTRDELAMLLGEAPDMNDRQNTLLEEIHAELYRRIKTRAGAGPNPDYADTILGYACNADGFGYRNEQRLIAMQATVDALMAAVADRHGLDAEEVRAIFTTELARAKDGTLPTN